MFRISISLVSSLMPPVLKDAKSPPVPILLPVPTSAPLGQRAKGGSTFTLVYGKTKVREKEPSPLRHRLFGTFFISLLLTATLSAADLAKPSQQQAILDNVRQYVSRYLDNLPNFVCNRITEQYEAGKKPKNWHQGDTLTAKLVFNQGREDITLVLVNGKPLQPNKYVKRPLHTEGEFGELVGKVLDPDAGAQISWSDWEDMAGRRLAVFEYLVDRSHSTLRISLGTRDQIVPYRGQIYADASTGEIWRITSAPFDLPAGLETKSAVTTIDYAPIDIAGRRFVLPTSASVLLDTGRNNILNKVSFTNYRKFDAESKIIFSTASN